MPLHGVPHLRAPSRPVQRGQKLLGGQQIGKGFGTFTDEQVRFGICEPVAIRRALLSRPEGRRNGFVGTTLSEVLLKLSHTRRLCAGPALNQF
jgi:hypothetical protein